MALANLRTRLSLVKLAPAPSIKEILSRHTYIPPGAYPLAETPVVIRFIFVRDLSTARVKQRASGPGQLTSLDSRKRQQANTASKALVIFAARKFLLKFLVG